MAKINGPVNLFRDEQVCTKDKGFVIQLKDEHDFDAALELGLPVVNRAMSSTGSERTLVPVSYSGNNVILCQEYDLDILKETLAKINAIANKTRSQESQEKKRISSISTIGSENKSVVAY